jgi:hypothetical protein
MLRLILGRWVVSVEETDSESCPLVDTGIVIGIIFGFCCCIVSLVNIRKLLIKVVDEI